MLPAYFLFRKNMNVSLIDMIISRSPVLGKFVAGMFILYFFYFTVTTISRLDLFAGTVVFPETDVQLVLVFAIILCCYGAYLGIEPLGRGAVLSTIFVIPAIIFILLTLTDKVDLLNLSPLFYNGVTPVLKTAADSVGQTCEYAILLIILPKIQGKIKKPFMIWLVSQTVLMAILFFFAGSVMGNFTGTQLFPFHTLTSLAQFSMFSRLDALFTSLWIMCAFIKAGLLIYLQCDLLTQYFGRFSKKQYLITIGFLTSLICLLISQKIQYFLTIDNNTFKVIFTLFVVLIIPVLCIGRCKKWEK